MVSGGTWHWSISNETNPTKLVDQMANKDINQKYIARHVIIFPKLTDTQKLIILNTQYVPTEREYLFRNLIRICDERSRYVASLWESIQLHSVDICIVSNWITQLRTN